MHSTGKNVIFTLGEEPHQNCSRYWRGITASSICFWAVDLWLVFSEAIACWHVLTHGELVLWHTGKNNNNNKTMFGLVCCHGDNTHQCLLCLRERIFTFICWHVYVLLRLWHLKYFCVETRKGIFFHKQMFHLFIGCFSEVQHFWISVCLNLLISSMSYCYGKSFPVMCGHVYSLEVYSSADEEGTLRFLHHFARLAVGRCWMQSTMTEEIIFQSCELAIWNNTLTTIKINTFFCCKQHMANQESTREWVAAVTELIWLTEPQVIHLSHV